MTLGKFLIGLIVCFFSATAVPANQLRRMPLAEQMERASLVLVGRLGQRSTCPFQGEMVLCAEIVPELVMKGAEPPAGSYLLLQPIWADDDVSWMCVPGRALFFLGGSGNIYGRSTANIPYSSSMKRRPI